MITQTITTKSGEEYTVDQMEYPVANAGILYIRFMSYNHLGQKTEILTFQPQDIVKRSQVWTQEIEDELITNSEKAKSEYEAQQNQQVEYQQAVKEELHKRSQTIEPEVETETADDPTHLYG